MTIYISADGLPPELRAHLLVSLKGHELVFGDVLDNDALRRLAVAAADVVFGNVPVAWLVASPRLQWVQLDSAGVDAYLGINLQRSSPAVQLSNLNDFYGRAVSEAALAGMLAFYRQLPRLLAAQRERRWIKREVEPAIGQLHGTSVVILGAGAIGQRLASLLQPFECEVRFFARTSPLAHFRTLAELDQALASTDVLVNTLPHTSETAGILNRLRLRCLKPTALLVNVGRGSALDELALVDALDSRQIAGAVLDVTTVEPLPADSPLWTHPLVILTQHTGGRFPGEPEAKVARFLANFARFSRGEPLSGAVDVSRGY